MADFDVFNGDADGLTALVQLRRADPRPDAKIITGRKRDIQLLDRVFPEVGDRVTVLDISARSNAEDLRRILDAGADVFYADHHNAGDLPEADNFTALINTAPEMCTAVIIDRHLKGAYRAWAVTGAFGDNFPNLARRLAHNTDLPLDALEELGVLLNYNGYGASVEDLHFHPEDLYGHMAPFDTPMGFMAEKQAIFETLQTGYASDMAMAQTADVIDQTERGLIIELPDAAASRRVSGVYGNRLAQDFPERAHGVLTRREGGYVVSVRAPLSNRTGADTLCLQFETGGGRAAAAGINYLPEADLDRFVKAFRESF